MTTAAAIAEAVRDGRTSARAVVELAIARIEAGNARVNAIVDFHPEEGLAAAEEVDRRIASGEAALPLAGVPVVVKDNIWVRGRRVTQGSRLFADFVPPADAIAVSRLRAAGAVVIGMGNCPEFAAKGFTANLVYGVTRNPLDPTRTPGGSSGGCAAALAGGMVPLALGTDGGGSGRRPAAHCGVVGFKPSQGAIPHAPGFPGPFHAIEAIAPMARGVADATLLFDAIAGPDPRDPAAVPVSAAEPARTLRIALSRRFGLDAPIDADVEQAMERAYARLGAVLEPADPVWPDGFDWPVLAPMVESGLAERFGAAWRADPSRFDPEIGAQIERGLAATGPLVAAASLMSRAITLALAAFFTRFDLLIGPTVPCEPWLLDRTAPDRIGGVPVGPRGHAVFTGLFNHALVPAISIPCGAGANGLPVGLQIVGPRYADRRVLRFAADAERALASPA